MPLGVIERELVWHFDLKKNPNKQKTRGPSVLVVWTPLSWDMGRDRCDEQGKMESWVCLGRLYNGAVLSPAFIRKYNICIYLSQLRAQVREGQSFAFACADLGGLCRLSLAVAAPVRATPVLQYPAMVPFFLSFDSKGE